MSEESMQQQIDQLKADFAEVLEYLAAIHKYLGAEIEQARRDGTELGNAHAKHVSRSHSRAVDARVREKHQAAKAK